MRLRRRLSSGEWWSAPAGNRFVGWCAGAAFAPFGILALRIAAIRPRVYLAGDLAIMDVTVRRALHWQGALGPYDRFHWHHPGPILVYMFAFADRIVGASNGAAAQMIVAALVAAVCLGGIVLALAWEQKLSRTTVLLAVATTLAFALLLGDQTVLDPWNPHIVVLPMVLLGFLAARSWYGSASSFLAAGLVATFAIQCEIGTFPLAAALVLVAATGTMRAWRRGELALRWRDSLWLIAAIAFWIPPIVQQATHHPGNLTLITRFFLASHPQAGITYGIAATGGALASSFGFTAPVVIFGPPTRVFVEYALMSAAAVAALSYGVVARERHIRLFAALACGAIVVSTVASADITGLVGTYLVAWAAAPAVWLVVGAIPATARWVHGARAGLASALAVTALVIVAVSVVRPSLNTAEQAPNLGRITSLVTHELRGRRHPSVAIDFSDWTTGWLTPGLADQLDMRGIRYAVPSIFRFPLGSTARSSSMADTVALVDRGYTPPAGLVEIGRAGTVGVYWGPTPPRPRHIGHRFAAAKSAMRASPGSTATISPQNR